MEDLLQLSLHIQAAVNVLNKGRSSAYLEEIILMNHTAVGERLDDSVGQGGFTTVGDTARRGEKEAGEPH